MRRRLVMLCGGVVLVTVLTGCTSTANGTPTAAPPPTSEEQPPPESVTTTPSTDNTDGAPRVEHPLDATRFLPQPCAVLTPAQLATLDISTPGKPETTGAVAEHAGPMCTWIADGPDRDNYNVGFLTGNQNGLSDTYRGSWPGYFEPTTVDGYPAVFNDVIDSRDTGACNLTVGINDNLTFRTQLQTRTDRGRESCDGAMQLARMVIATIKAGG